MFLTSQGMEENIWTEIAWCSGVHSFGSTGGQWNEDTIYGDAEVWK